MPAQRRILALIAGFVAVGCAAERPDSADAQDGETPVVCVEDNGGITLPPGFCASVFADEVGPARHIAVREDGIVFVNLRAPRGQGWGGLLMLRDGDGDGVADASARIDDLGGGTGVTLDGDLVYVAATTAVHRIRVPMGTMEAVGAVDTIVAHVPRSCCRGGTHQAKPLVLRDGWLYLNVGSTGNACAEAHGQPGMDPCAQLDSTGGIWRFSTEATGQMQADGERYATGTRNVIGLTLGPDGLLYGVQHGRDMLVSWGFSVEDNAEKPAEEMFRIEQGDDFGWPYCYYDRQLERKVLAPEYGGDGEVTGRCADKKDPIVSFPGHWGPHAITFYEGDAFPERYRGGAFVAFHGSWNRAPLPQGGYNVAFVPFADGEPSGDWEVFADGFAGADVSPRGATHRPAGGAVGPDGALYVTDDRGGRVWRIVYAGD
ncbi:MAG: PQQ-dependent sugar dehydrogenase [Gemmatimonadota bacterium]